MATVTITSFGLEAGTDRKLYVNWSWNKEHTKNFSVNDTPAISVVPNVVMNGSKFSSIQYATDSSTITKIRNIYLSISSSEVVEIK